MKSQLMHLAAALRKTGLSLSAALKRAWRAIKLKTQMATKAVGFYYRKENGSERYALGCYKLAPASTLATVQPTGPLVIRYYDILCDDWRSFRADRLILDGSSHD